MKRMKNKKINSAMIAGAVAAAVMFGSMGLSTLSNGNVAPLKVPQAATKIVNKTPESEAKIYYIGSKGVNGETEGDGTSANSVMWIETFVRNHIDNLKPGDIVRIMPGEHLVGNYNKYYDGEEETAPSNSIKILRSGTYDNYIIFEAADPANKPTLNFKKQIFDSTNRGIQMYGSYIYWHDIDVCGAGDNGLYIGGSYNVVENCEFYNNRDTGLQLGRAYSAYSDITRWPSYNLVKNCTSYNNYDNETYGENADGFAAKLTVGYGNIFDGCIAYRNSDDGWDLYAKSDTGNIGKVIMYNCVAFDNGFLQKSQKECNDWYTYTDENGTEIKTYNNKFDEGNTYSFLTRDGDGNGFKLGGGTMEGDVELYNCISFHNRMHGVTDNSNPGVLSINNVTGYNNGIQVDSRKYSSVTDESGKTTYTVDNAAVDYYDVNQDGYIINTSNNKLILDENGANKSDYYTVDEAGYILNKDKSRLPDGNGGSVKGSYVHANLTKCTENPDYGKIVITGATPDADNICNNIDIERTSGSYNNFQNILSVNHGSDLTGSDRYKGSGANSIFTTGKDKNAKLEGVMDADYLNSKKRATAMSAGVNASTLFAELPASDLGLSALHYVHNTYRNADGSINMGNLLKITDQSVLLGADKPIGADLTKTSYEAYTHYDYTYLTDGEQVTNETDALLTAVYNMLYVPVKLDACYQDFKAVTAMLGCSIEWTADKPEVLEVVGNRDISLSYSQRTDVIVYRQAQDTIVNLTAKIKAPDGTEMDRTFVINVKALTNELGEVVLDSASQEAVIIDQYSVFDEPEVNVTNASDYNGKLLSKDAYTVETKYMYSAGKGGLQTPVKYFTSSHAGVYEIFKTVTLGSESRTFSYNVFIVSGSATVDFVKDENNAPKVSVGVDNSGYYITGEINNVSGTLYAMVSDTAPTASELISGGTAYKITSDSIYANFEADNSHGYNVYYLICNPNGQATSEVYCTEIKMQTVSNEQEFTDMLANGGSSNVIYQLSADLDFTGKPWTTAEKPFIGYFDGQNHTIKGISATADKDGLASVFYQLYGGTIVNVNFSDIKLNGKQNVGIIGSAYSGYVANVRITNIDVKGVQRISALIGRAYEQIGAPLVIDRVSVINTDKTLTIEGNGSSSRAAGILGFMQTNREPKSDKVEVRISNCFVDAVIGNAKANENGGIVGTWDDDYAHLYVSSYSLDLSNCVFLGTAMGKSRVGGIIAYQKGIQRVRVRYCVSYGTLYHAGAVTPVETAEKNCSGIFGGYAKAADTQVVGCYARFADHNDSYDVRVFNDTDITSKTIWNTLSFDMEVWEYVEENGSLVAPYIRLK